MGFIYSYPNLKPLNYFPIPQSIGWVQGQITDGQQKQKC